MLTLVLSGNGLLMAQGQVNDFRATSGPFSFDIRKKSQPRLPTYVNHALLIANSQYDDRRYPVLPNCVYDADSLKNLLVAKFNFTADLLPRATEQDFVSELEKLKSRAWQDTDQLLIYIAGHGGFDPTIQDGFLVMRNANKTEQTHRFWMGSLKRFLKSLPCKHVLLILDVCYGGTFDDAIAMENNVIRGEFISTAASVPTDDRRAEYVRNKLKPQTRIFLASGGKEPVREGRSEEHSPFAKALLTQLNRTINADGKLLTVYDLTSLLEKEVPTVVLRAFEGNEEKGDFLFIAK